MFLTRMAVGRRASLPETVLKRKATTSRFGNAGVAGEWGRIHIGRQVTQTATFIAGISGATVAVGAVVVNSSGQLGVAPSSSRFKDAITRMDKASEAILALQPVTFRYKKPAANLSPSVTPKFLLIRRPETKEMLLGCENQADVQNR
jgi:hypothetical protein